MSRFQQYEAIAADARDLLPRTSLAWLAAVRAPLEELTLAALDPEVSDAAFRERVEAFAQRLPELFGELEHDALAELLESAMGAAMANGIAERYQSLPKDLRAKAPAPAALHAAGKGKPCGGSFIPQKKKCR